MAKRALRFAPVAAILILVFFIILSNYGGASAKADVAASPRSSEVVTSYEKRNVWEDLQGATIDGEGIDLNLYNWDGHKNVQIISFIEYCYSFYADNQGDYGLYVYVYNPRGLDFTKNTILNKISLKYTGTTSSGYEKFHLQLLNYSNKSGYEGLFYKFKVALTNAQRTAILSALKSSGRVYEIIEIELCSEGPNATAYGVASKYTYTGFAKGYGPANASGSTLGCKVDGFNEYLTLDVHPTYYRPKGTHSDGFTRDTLHSVYFSVPNSMIEEYGEMSAVHAQWLNALTAPMLVTGNRDIYNAIYPYLNQEIKGYSVKDNVDPKLKYICVATKAVKEGIDNPSAVGGGYYSYNAFTDYYGTGIVNAVLPAVYDNVIKTLNYLFYAENGDADSYDLPREKLVGDKSKGVKGWLETFTERFANGSTQLVNGKYCKELFDKVDEKFTDINIKATDEYHLTDNTVSNSLWDKIFGTQLKGENSFDISAIQPVTQKDLQFYPDKTIFCDKFYIAERDYDNLCEFVNTSAKKTEPETVYLFRYYQSEYVCHETTEYSKSRNDYSVIDTNAYIAQSWVQLDFDIIDVTFTKDDVDTVIPCIMSPMDLAADTEHPVDPTPDDKGGLPWWAWLLIGVAVVVVIVLLIKFFPSVIAFLGKAIFWIIALPFRILWAVICAPFRIIKQRKEKRKKALERELKREEKRQAKAQEKLKTPPSALEPAAVPAQAEAAVTENKTQRKKPKTKAKDKPAEKPAKAPAVSEAKTKKKKEKPAKERKQIAKLRPRKDKAAKDTPRGNN